MSEPESMHYNPDLPTTYYGLDDRRRAALQEIDTARFSWRFHARVCLVAGVGFFTDAYDIFAISIASTMLGMVYGSGSGIKTLNARQHLGITIATPVGNIVGQILFGFLADIVGRKRMYGIELMIMILATFAQALCGSGPAVGIIGALIVWRFILGVGIGGDYPLSAVISSEFAPTHIRGRMITATFAAQGWGNLSAAIVALIIVSAYKSAIESDPFPSLHHVDFTWRLLIGLGCVPGVIALYFRLTIPETPRFTMDIDRNVAQASSDIRNVLETGKYYVDRDAVVERVDAPKASRRDFIRHFGKWSNGKVLLGTMWSWFAIDIPVYGFGLNSSLILTIIHFGSTASPNAHGAFQQLKNVCVGNIVLSLGGLIPGFYFTMLLVDFWGRKPIQLMGFTVLTCLFVVMGFGFDAMMKVSAGQKAFVFLYCLSNFFQNFGPNSTTFIIPGEVFPTRYRSTAHGLSAASGKLGAVLAQIVLFALNIQVSSSDSQIGHLFEVFALFMLTGIFSTLLLPETKGKSLEELSNEDQRGFISGPASGTTNAKTGKEGAVDA